MKLHTTRIMLNHCSKHSPLEYLILLQYAVLYEARANTGVDRMKIINAVAKCVPQPHKVDLSNPDRNIVVQIAKVWKCFSFRISKFIILLGGQCLTAFALSLSLSHAHMHKLVYFPTFCSLIFSLWINLTIYICINKKKVRPWPLSLHLKFSATDCLVMELYFCWIVLARKL